MIQRSKQDLLRRRVGEILRLDRVRREIVVALYNSGLAIRLCNNDIVEKDFDHFDLYF